MKIEVFALCLIAVASNAAADTWTDANGVEWCYEVKDGVAVISSGWGMMAAISNTVAGTITVPARLDGCCVKVGSYAFYGCKLLTEIIIPSDVLSIGYAAFSGCSGLERVSLPKYISEIPEESFSGCSKLGAILCPESVVKIGSHAFSRCSNLKEIVLQGGVSSIGEYAFYRCENVSNVVIPQSVVSIGGNAFSECTSVRRVKTSGAFSLYDIFPGSYSKIEEVEVVDGSVGITGRAFYRCASLKSVTIPETVRDVGGYAFDSCSSLEEVVLPASLETIGTYAFNMCGGLKKIILPRGLRSIGNYAFDGCSALSEVSVPSCIKKLSTTFPGAYKKITKAVVCDGVTSIVDSAFAGAESLVSVEIPASVTLIGNSAFSGCSSLQNVIMNGDAPDLGANAFDGTPKRLVVQVPFDSIGWDGSLSTKLPETWGGRAIVHSGERYNWDEGVGYVHAVAMTVTNVVINYVLQSVQPEFVQPYSGDGGFVNIITEVRGGAITVPASWSANYPDYTKKFGNDFSKSLCKKTGKRDGAGKEMFVWQDYVAGTDPTDPDDVFTASIVISDGKIVISYSPELDDEQKAMRVYTTWGKKSLMDEKWVVVQDGDEGQYNFFKVSVEMRD